jgi:flagellar basal body-associated protein FliL
LKKTLIATLTTVITAGGVWLTTHLFGGEATDKEETKTEQVAPAPAAPVVINLQNNNTNQQKQSGGTNTVIKERVIEKAAPAPTSAPAAAPAQKESW